MHFGQCTVLPYTCRNKKSRSVSVHELQVMEEQGAGGEVEEQGAGAEVLEGAALQLRLNT